MEMSNLFVCLVGPKSNFAVGAFGVFLLVFGLMISAARTLCGGQLIVGQALLVAP